MTTQFKNERVPAVATLRDNVSNTTYSFPYNVNSVTFSYQMNTQSVSTIGGRVTQLLSARINTLNIQGEAGSRQKLLTLYEQFKTTQDNQNLNKVSMTLSIPSQKLTFNVWLEQMQIGWGIDTVTYMYNMYFEVDQDLSVSSALNSSVIKDALNRINKGVGFNSDYVGFTTQSVNLKLTG